MSEQTKISVTLKINKSSVMLYSSQYVKLTGLSAILGHSLSQQQRFLQVLNRCYVRERVAGRNVIVP